MTEKLSAIIVSRDERLAQALSSELFPVAVVTEVIRDIKPAYYVTKREQPHLLFINLEDDPEPGFSLARKVVMSLPDTLVFVTSVSKDPDLILRALRAGVDDYLLFPSDDGSVPASVQQAVEKRTEHREKRCEIIAFFSPKGGQGVTTLAVNLADHIQSQTGKKVILIDLNLQTGDMAVQLGIKPAYLLADFINDLERLDENLLHSSLTRHSRGFYVIPAPEEISEKARAAAEEITPIFQVLKEYMDYIIVDLSHDLAGITADVLDFADTICLVAQQTVQSVSQAKRAVKLFRETGYGEEKVKIILNRWANNNVLGRQDIENIFDKTIFAQVSNDYFALTEAVEKGRLVSEIKKDSKMNRDMAQLASRITGIEIKEEKKGFLAKTILNFKFLIKNSKLRIKN